MQVWIITSGEDYEGGGVDGVYATRDAAAADFIAAAGDLNGRFSTTIDDADVHGDGSVYLHNGCDWLRLDLWDVKEHPELPAARIPGTSRALEG